jgi:hypothetical protein
MAKQQWRGEGVEAMLEAQGIALAPGRAERLARGLEGLLQASAADPLRTTLEFHADPPGFVLALDKCK